MLAALDEIEGYDASTPDTSLYVRRQVPVHLDDDAEAEAWAYFYNAPLGQARRIASGDYLTHLKVNKPSCHRAVVTLDALESPPAYRGVPS